MVVLVALVVSMLGSPNGAQAKQIPVQKCILYKINEETFSFVEIFRSREPLTESFIEEPAYRHPYRSILCEEENNLTFLAMLECIPHGGAECRESWNWAETEKEIPGTHLVLSSRTIGTNISDEPYWPYCGTGCGYELKGWIARAKRLRSRGRRRGERFGSRNEAEPDFREPCEDDPVNCATGDLTETQTDLAVGGVGVPLDLTRSYNSQAAMEASSPGMFGFGWASSLSDRLEINSNEKTVTAVQGNGSTVMFEGNPEMPGELKAPRWAQAKLTVQSDGTFVYTLPDQEILYFSKEGRLISETDRNGNITSLSYNEAHQLITVTDPSGRKLKLTYNGEGLVESVEDPMGHVVKYAYESGNLKSVTEPGETSPRWQFKYDASHEMTEMTDGGGGKTVNEYNGAHQVISQKDPLGHVTRFEYEAEGTNKFPEGAASIAEETPQEEREPEMLSATEEEKYLSLLPSHTEPPQFVTLIKHEATGEVTREHFDSEGQLTTVTHGYGTGQAATTSYEYNSGGEVAAVVDPNSHKTEYSYDVAGDRTSERDPDGNETKWEYDSTHDVIGVTTPKGEKTTIERDSHGNATKISRPGPSETTQVSEFKYASNGNLESYTNPLKNTWKYEYDTNGDRTAEIDPLSNKRTWEYNEDSQETSTVSPRGYVKAGEESKYTTKIERDTQGRPLTITDPLGHTTKYKYDGDGNVEKITDGNNHTTTYTYNADNEQLKVKVPNGTVTETEYDGAGKVVAQIDSNKHTTKYVRNVLEEVTEVVDPLGRKTLKEYDHAGNLVKLTDSEKRTTTYTYDPANRLTEISYSSGKPATVKYEYDKDGNRMKMVDGTGTTKYEYDQLDRLTEVENGHKEVVKYEYDLTNKKTKITYPNGKAVTRAYDKDGRLEKVTDWLGNATQFAYNADSELGRTTFPSATEDVDKYEYNQADQMSSQTMVRGTEKLASYGYGHDGINQVTTIANHNGESGEEKTAYEYDAENRLFAVGGTTVYEYDGANNPTKIGSDTYSYNAAGELEKGTGFTYTYNEEGQRTKTTPEKGPATTYDYDQAGDLTSAERPEGESNPKIEDTYAYNGDGLRTSQTISGTTSYFAWDVTESVPLILSDGTNSYIYGPGGLPIEQINNTTGAVQYLHHDQQGSTRLITGSSGTVEGKCSYSAYGTPTCEGSAATTPLGYDAQYTSSDTGLIYLRAREYDPATAQFLSRDPLAAETDAPYSYAGDNPLTYGDPSGLSFGSFLEEVDEGITGWGDTITFGGTEWVREQLGDNNIDACSGAYQAGGIAGLVTGVLIPGEGEAEIGAEGLDEALAGLRESKAGIYEVDNEEELQALYDGLSHGGEPATPEGYDGEMVKLPNGTRVGLRNTSSSGGPALDIHQPGQPAIKVHLPNE